MTKAPKVGQCLTCQKWGLMRGKFCLANYKQCRRKWTDWIDWNHEIFDYDPTEVPFAQVKRKKRMGPQKPDIFKFFAQGHAIWNYGTMTKRLIHK